MSEIHVGTLHGSYGIAFHSLGGPVLSIAPQNRIVDRQEYRWSLRNIIKAVKNMFKGEEVEIYNGGSVGSLDRLEPLQETLYNFVIMPKETEGD